MTNMSTVQRQDSALAEDIRDNLSLTDDEDNDEFEDESAVPELSGTLSKWTNYIHGWQDRYIVLKDSTLSYYKSETETSFGCRGAVSLSKAVISPHEFDECRFDVSVNDCLWYLRAQNPEERQRWIENLEIHKQQTESGYGSENSLRRHGSILSLNSTASLSTASASSFKRGRGLREKLAEMETFRDILCRQVDTLQSYFDACATALAEQTVHDINCDTDDIDDVDDFDSPNGSNVLHQNNKHTGTYMTQLDGPKEKDIVNILEQHGAHAIDFKGEAFTFKATTAGILATLCHCIELMSQREDAWKKRLEREVEKRKKVEDSYKSLLTDRPKIVAGLGGPDYEEGPHSKLTEDEFFDAVDATLDKLEKEEEEKRKLMQTQAKTRTESPITPPTALTSLDPSHPFYNEVNEVVADHITHADMTASDVADTWTLISEENEMKVYKRELEEDGLVVDPFKAVHTVKGKKKSRALSRSGIIPGFTTVKAVYVTKGITGHEMCHFFWDPAIRLDWEGTLDSSQVVEWFSQDTMVTYQTHKRVWPSSQRDSLFWSTIRHCPSEDDEGPDYWIVANHSTDHPNCPIVKCVRMRFNVAMICQTVVTPPENGQEMTRDNICCRIQYSANINPGGWAPASVIRVISKREVPKFLKTFTQYVQNKTQDQPIMF